MTNKELFSILKDFNTAVTELMHNDNVFKISIWKNLKIIRFKCWDKEKLVRIELRYNDFDELSSYKVEYTN